MKTKTLTLLTAVITLTGMAMAQAQEATSILFVPSQSLEATRTSGKLKDNTFHWTNLLADPKQGPTVAKDGNTQFLLIKGAGTQASPKENTIVTVVRAFNVPAGAKYAKIVVEGKTSYDEWIDNAPRATKTLPTLTYSFVKDGKEARANTKIDLGERNAGTWHRTELETDIPTGAQQIVIVGKTDFPATLSLTALNVTFSDKAPEKPKKKDTTPAAQ